MTKTVTRLGALGFVLFTIALTPFAKADEWNKKTVITTHQPIQIQGKVLEPGEYVMELLNSPYDRHIVQIYDANETKLEMTILASPAYRVDLTGNTRLTFSLNAKRTSTSLTYLVLSGRELGHRVLRNTLKPTIRSPRRLVTILGATEVRDAGELDKDPGSPVFHCSGSHACRGAEL